MAQYIELDVGIKQYIQDKNKYALVSSVMTKGIKRTLEFILSLTVIMLTSPIMIIVALLVKLTSIGPILYSQERVGEYGEIFNVYKFRSMRTDAEKDGPQWASENDDRVTSIGNFIRRARLDELPQLFNVLKGEMSLVGPRPERAVFMKDLEKEIPFYDFRHSVKPGITGWAQVNYPYGASVEDARWKHKYDLYYIKNYSILLDIKILFMTIGVVFFGRGR